MPFAIRHSEQLQQLFDSKLQPLAMQLVVLL
jgi:hypothetical protein